MVVEKGGATMFNQGPNVRTKKIIRKTFFFKLMKGKVP